ncbi:hypothetical protein Nepgr_016467 [Nepenthes gracilis]|uniref:Uncharacterized protein n=1 Tax=Nepenthes gracilis TaxID=150966 RepID=A0AAD3XSC7_NEPGR|nr:hypothetical protein Nepgr_016467 [Nepenthes gracilis]
MQPDRRGIEVDSPQVSSELDGLAVVAHFKSMLFKCRFEMLMWLVWLMWLDLLLDRFSSDQMLIWNAILFRPDWKADGYLGWYAINCRFGMLLCFGRVGIVCCICRTVVFGRFTFARCAAIQMDKEAVCAFRPIWCKWLCVLFTQYIAFADLESCLGVYPVVPFTTESWKAFRPGYDQMPISCSVSAGLESMLKMLACGLWPICFCLGLPDVELRPILALMMLPVAGVVQESRMFWVVPRDVLKLQPHQPVGHLESNVPPISYADSLKCGLGNPPPETLQSPSVASTKPSYGMGVSKVSSDPCVNNSPPLGDCNLPLACDLPGLISELVNTAQPPSLPGSENLDLSEAEEVESLHVVDDIAGSSSLSAGQLSPMETPNSFFFGK